MQDHLKRLIENVTMTPEEQAKKYQTNALVQPKLKKRLPRK